MPALQEFLANEIRTQAKTLERGITAMPDDKTAWKVDGSGRTAHEMLLECAGLNFHATHMLSTKSVPVFDPERRKQVMLENDTVEKALALLSKSIEAVTAAILAFPSDQIDETLTLPFGGGMVRSYAQIAYFPLWNMSYHEGQMNFIQTLYGDMDMH